VTAVPQERAAIEPAEIVAGDVLAVTAELDAAPATRAAMRARVDAFGDEARANPAGGTAAGATTVGGASVDGGASAEAGAAFAGGASGAGGASAEPDGGEAGAGGVGSESPTTDALLGDYDVFLSAPPTVNGCTVAWYQPRINLTVYTDWTNQLTTLPFADFFWQGNFAKNPTFTASRVEVPAILDWADELLAPALELEWNADGFTGTGTAQIPYACSGGARASRTVAVTVVPDHTSPRLRVDPNGAPSFGFTRFAFTFSEPVRLPSGDYGITFSEPADGEQALSLYDVDTDAALPIGWKWSLAGPVALARFLDPAAAEGRTVAARLLATLDDHAGNPLVTLDQTFDVEPAALLTTELDFDTKPAGLYGNASYHATAEPGAACEDGGCLVLDGPIVACYDAPAGGLGVRMASSWEGLQLRYRVWASTYSVSPLAIGYASGCTGMISVELKALAQPDGVFTHASEWITAKLAPCGGPDDENGFTLALDCSEYRQPPPDVRVVIERIARP